jgi:effector-binding domain-containing protein
MKMKMEFMAIFEGSNEKYLQYDNKIKRILVQEDVWDFHIFRIIENSENDFTVEMDNIDKEKVLEFMGLDINGDVRGKFKKLPAVKVIEAVIEVDIDNGFETYQDEDFSSMEEAISEITGDIYEVNKISKWYD